MSRIEQYCFRYFHAWIFVFHCKISLPKIIAQSIQSQNRRKMLTRVKLNFINQFSHRSNWIRFRPHFVSKSKCVRMPFCTLNHAPALWSSKFQLGTVVRLVTSVSWRLKYFFACRENFHLIAQLSHDIVDECNVSSTPAQWRSAQHFLFQLNFCVSMCWGKNRRNKT